MRRILWTVGIFLVVVLPIQSQTHWRGCLNLPTGRTAFEDRSEFETYKWFAQHTRPVESYIGIPSYNFALSLENPTTVDYLIDTDYTTKDQVAAAIKGLRAHAAETIGLDRSSDTNGSLVINPRHGNLAPFIAYVHVNYHLAKVFFVTDENHADEVWQRNVTNR